MPRTARLATLIALSLAAACGKEPCVEENLVYKYSETVNGQGIYASTPIAKFDLTQNFLSHTPYASCTTGPLVDVGLVDIALTNVTPNPLLLYFDAQGLNDVNVAVWAFGDTVRNIGPGQTITYTKAVVTPAKLEHGARVTITLVKPLN